MANDCTKIEFLSHLDPKATSFSSDPNLQIKPTGNKMRAIIPGIGAILADQRFWAACTPEQVQELRTKVRAILDDPTSTTALMVPRQDITRTKPGPGAVGVIYGNGVLDLVGDRKTCLDLFFDGYDSDPREIYQIPEVQTFYAGFMLGSKMDPSMLQDRGSPEAVLHGKGTPEDKEALASIIRMGRLLEILRTPEDQCRAMSAVGALMRPRMWQPYVIGDGKVAWASDVPASVQQLIEHNRRSKELALSLTLPGTYGYGGRS